ncbi:MAG: hypothetical protein JRD89_09970 [Deltaproteobacteria bacterium]|nr:hypothetical protein [Deltaproteobacteria bacterium]
MKKRVMIFIGGVIIIIAGLLVAVFLNLSSIIKTAVNIYGPDITKTEVRLADVDVSLLSGRAEIKGLYFGNPGGFRSPEALAVESISVDVDEKSLISNPIIIEKIEVIAPEITYEKKGGTDNLQTILNNIKEKAGVEKGSEEKTGGKVNGKKDEGKKIIIRDVTIRDGKVILAVSMLGGSEITVALPDIHLADIGKKKGGASPAEAAGEIFAALYEKITAPDTMRALDGQIEKLESVLDETKKAVGQAKAVGKETEQRARALRDKIKGILGE